MGQDNSHPQPGDLIEIDRLRHQHWALYLGDGYVIHLTPVGKEELQLGVCTVPVFIRKVKKQCLKEVLQNNTWRVNNKYDHSCTPRPVEEIIQRAESYNDRELKYHGFGSNCKHFVTELRYGEGVSEQANIALEKFNSISSAVNYIGTTGMGAVSYFVGPSGLVVGVASSFLFATIHFASSHVAESFTCAKFVNTKKDILERRCC